MGRKPLSSQFFENSGERWKNGRVAIQFRGWSRGEAFLAEDSQAKKKRIPRNSFRLKDSGKNSGRCMFCLVASIKVHRVPRAGGLPGRD